ncbi:GNAT family N-acetyltransferase [Amaricoccus solimangrovi]|uniref:GNAT family N-acetyltransferase n=1 Tax=Amaricoccus solimangrovi TaxID=2589815 RepID=A0A501WSM6_9RHOB|nr:GNAT family N-acetyltransferase [Amaricoccus solimangrovi]TPE51355.1 GNAT family N-acetyltransferase [Amaricoccus solimangrovi]
MSQITPTRASDEADWRRLWRAYLAFYDTERPDEVYAHSFARLVDPAVTEYNGLIAREDGRAVGIVNYIFHCHGWQPAGVCYLQDLYVAPEARGGGVGRALIEAVYAAADAAGRPEVYWLTQADNARARRLYDAVGVATPFMKYRRPPP